MKAKAIYSVLAVILIFFVGIALWKFNNKPSISENIDINKNGEKISEATSSENTGLKECVAVASVPKDKEDEFREKYFTDEEYKELKNINLGNEEKFVIIPRNKDVMITVKKCHIDDNGQICEDEAVCEKYNGTVAITTEMIETMPKIIVKIDYKEETFSFPLYFSGLDGRLVFAENEDKIIDISI